MYVIQRACDEIKTRVTVWKYNIYDSFPNKYPNNLFLFRRITLYTINQQKP